jgi:hypothetical protein
MKLIYLTLFIFTFCLAGCDTNKEKNTERTVIDRDTVDVETEYEVEEKVREKTVTVDTVTETEKYTEERSDDRSNNPDDDRNPDF